MREHKYRAWDKKKKRWLGVNLHMSIVDGLLWWQFGYGCEILSAEERENIEITQYIGLKDINKIELYEGDIVSDHFKQPDEDWYSHYLGPSKKGTIVWDADHAGFYIETDRWEDDTHLTEITGSTTLHQIMPEWIEKIGNIFQNPELSIMISIKQVEVVNGNESNHTDP